MKEEIKATLGLVVGLPLMRTTRAANMECLKFGTHLSNVKDEGPLNIGEFGLHLQCPWRITKGKGILIGSDDVYEQPDQNRRYDPDYDWDKNLNLRDKKLNELIQAYRLIIQQIEADEFGGFEIEFNDDFRLTAFPAISLKAEYWRLLDNRPTKAKHFVLGREGIWESK